VETDKPRAFAMPRERQCVAAGGVLSSVHDQRLNAGIIDRARRTRPRRVPQAIHAPRDKAPAPLADRRLIQRETDGDLLALLALGTAQHNAPPRR
jgi:hypothetical protein